MTAETLQWAQKAYKNSRCISPAEFLDDFARIKYVRRLLRRYEQTGQLRERLLLNHLVTLYNVFDSDMLTASFFAKSDKSLDPMLKAALLAIGQMPTRTFVAEGRKIVPRAISGYGELHKRLVNLP